MQFASSEGVGWQRLLAAHELTSELEILHATLPEDLTRDRPNRIRWGEDGRIEVEFSGRIGKDGPYHEYIFTGGGPRGFSFPVRVTYREWSDPDGDITHNPEWCARAIGNIDEHDEDCPYEVLRQRYLQAQEDETVEAPTDEEYAAAEDECSCGPDDCTCEPQVTRVMIAETTVWNDQTSAWVREWFQELTWAAIDEPPPEAPPLPSGLRVLGHDELRTRDWA